MPILSQMSTLRGGGASTSTMNELNSTFRWAEQTCPGFTDSLLGDLLEQLTAHTLGDQELRTAKDTLFRSSTASLR